MNHDFLMFKLVLKRQRNQRSNCQHLLDHRKSNRIQKNFYFCLIEYAKVLASLVAQRLKCLPGMRDTLVPSLGREDPLEKEMATYSSTLARRIPWREEPGGLPSMGSHRIGHN